MDNYLFQAEDGIRDYKVTEFRRVLFRSELPGRRYNLGVKFGLLGAQLALGLAGNDREEVLGQLVEALAARVGDSTCRPSRSEERRVGQDGGLRRGDEQSEETLGCV